MFTAIHKNWFLFCLCTFFFLIKNTQATPLNTEREQDQGSCLPLLDQQTTPSASTLDFFKHAAGKYKILSVNQKEPKETANMALIEYNSPEFIITAPYCSLEDFCDPGRQEFTEQDTTVASIGEGKYLITRTVMNENNTSTSSRFTWEEKDGEFYLINHQYENPPTLIHRLKKLD